MVAMLLAQLTDTHVLDPSSDEERWVDNNRRLAEAVAALNGERPRPELVLATGDLTNGGQPGELAELVRLLEPLETPVLPLPGNHDDRDGFRQAFDMPWTEPDHLSWVVDVDRLRLVGLDTMVPGEIGGTLDAERERWLTEALADDPDRPTAIAMHHPPFVSGIGFMDDSNLARHDAFADVVAANPQVGRIFCGHLHRPVQTTVAGVPVTVGPSTVQHVALDLLPGAPTRMIRDPAGYHLHRFDGTTWLTHTRYIDTGEAPFVPSWATGHS
jgi:3',5'-cyclic AMP phosphodiesterase CpdA